jgi:hypothetical protein
MMSITLDGYMCIKCGHKKAPNLDIINIRRPKASKAEPVYTGVGKENTLVVTRTCPECNNLEAYQSITVNIGEHAGVNTDRSIIRYKCTNCYHIWIEY